jgi:hypothetical protein
VLAAVGVLGLVVGYVLGGVVLSPKQASAPTAVEGLITAKVEARQITATVVGRADVAFADRVSVSPPIPDGSVSAVVTGQLPTVGAEVSAGNVVLEVSGRPVFVLRGAFPSYRSLGAGSSGADVNQLRAALNELGLNAGGESASYDAALASAVRALYERSGYAATDGGDAAAQGVRTAHDGVTDASTGVTQATSTLGQAQKALTRAKADQAEAQRDYDAALAGRIAGQAPPDAAGGGVTPDQAKQTLDQATIAVEQAQLGVQQAKDSVDSAQRGSTRAQEALTDAERAAWATVPVGAVVFVPDLPRRIDEVNVHVGQDLASLVSAGAGQGGPGQGGSSTPTAPIVLSGAQITVNAQIEMDQAKLLVVGGPAQLSVPGGEAIPGTIASMCDLAGSGQGNASGGNGGAGAVSSRCAVGITLVDPGSAGTANLVGNVQVTMTVGTSSTDSLIVPVAAVSADTAGHARVTLVEGRLETGLAARDQKTAVVDVETGLSAEGMVEITSATPAIKAGDLVVIGQGASQTSSDPTPR